MQLFGTFTGTAPPMLHPNYSTFPPTYSIVPPLVEPLLPSPPASKTSTQSSRVSTSSQWCSSVHTAKPTVLPTAWRFSSDNRPTSITNAQANVLREPLQHPKVRYNILSSTISRRNDVHEAVRTSSLRPFGFDPSGNPLPDDSARTDFDWSIMTTLFNNVMTMISNSVVSSTKKIYKTGWKRWLTFTATIGTDRYLQISPPAFQRYIDQSLQAVQMSWAILACSGYLAYLVSHPTKPTGAPTASRYLSAVRYNLKVFGMDISFMDASIFLKSARAGCIREWEALPGNSKSDRQTLPICISMIETSAAESLDLNISARNMWSSGSSI